MAMTKLQICPEVEWIDVLEPSAPEMEDLSKQYGLNTYTVRDCLQPEHLPKYEFADGVHFMILRFHARDAQKQLVTIQDLTNKVAIFQTPQFLITIHKNHVPFLDHLRKHFVNTDRCGSTSDLLTQVVWQALETYTEPANRLSEQIDFYESHVMRHKVTHDLTSSLYLIKREASTAHKVLMLMLEPINHMRLDDDGGPALQDVKDQHLKLQSLYGQVLDDVNNLMNLSLSFNAQRTNDVMKILTIFSVFFMPLTFIAGIYGMNFEFMPELKSVWGYPAVLVAMAVTTYFIFRWMKQKRWL